jgi:hypothetical protein
MALQGRLNILLWCVSAISKVFSKFVPRKRQKKSFRFLWKIGLSSFSNKKWSFIKQKIWSNILEDGRMHVFSVIMSKCLKKFLFIANDHMYTMNFFTQAEMSSFKLGLKTTRWFSLTLTNHHKNTIQVENQMIVIHLHYWSSLLTRNITHSSFLMLNIFNKTIRWCELFSIVLCKT